MMCCDSLGESIPADLLEPKLITVLLYMQRLPLIGLTTDWCLWLCNKQLARPAWFMV